MKIPHDKRKSMLELFIECPVTTCTDRGNNYCCYTNYQDCIFYKAYLRDKGDRKDERK